MTGRRDPTRREDLALALGAARAAGEAVMRWFRADPEVWHKGPDQPVTDADLRADALLAERLRTPRPGYGWLSEETADDPARLDRRRVWIVDPIDGTRSFIAGYREFAVSVGLVEDGEAVVGVVHNPATGEVTWATRGGGAFRAREWAEGSALEDIRAEGPLRVAAPGTGPPAVLASRSEIARGEFEALSADWVIRPLGSTACKLAGVSGGGGHAYLSRGPKSEWDVVAGALAVEEAGGVVTDLQGRRPGYNRPDPRVNGVLAAGPALHAVLLERVLGSGTPPENGR